MHLHVPSERKLLLLLLSTLLLFSVEPWPEEVSSFVTLPTTGAGDATEFWLALAATLIILRPEFSVGGTTLLSFANCKETYIREMTFEKIQ